jgi:hypothetical protein
MHRGLDFVSFPPNTVPSMTCKVCGHKMNVERQSKGPSSFAAALSLTINNHDIFWCANHEMTWHTQARDLMLEMQRTSSNSIRKILKEEVDDIVRTRIATIKS